MPPSTLPSRASSPHFRLCTVMMANALFGYGSRASQSTRRGTGHDAAPSAASLPLPALLKKRGTLRTGPQAPMSNRSEEHTSELQSLMRISYAVFCLKKKKQQTQD